jgi:ABC-type uncharacterized transport system ATPase subunit
MVQRRLGSSRAAVGWGDVLELQGLTRRYGPPVALDNLSFTVRERRMFGFVSPNGAGKTTAMRIMLGYWSPMPARSAGADKRMNMNNELRHRVGHMAEDHGQTFSTQFARLEAQQQQTLCQFGQQTQTPTNLSTLSLR